MAKRIITISREFGSGGRFIGEETAKKPAQTIMTKILSVRLPYSLGYYRSISGKRQNYRQGKAYLHMLSQGVILPENQQKIWYMKRREK